jgi:hypothetical protein
VGRVGRAGGRRPPGLLSELPAAAQHIDPHPGPRRNCWLEPLVEQSLLERGFPVRAAAGGVELLGTLPASDSRSTGDHLPRADVIGEWKAYQTAVPKNALMLSKAKTDDIFESLADRQPVRPSYRVVGVVGGRYQAHRPLLTGATGMSPKRLLVDGRRNIVLR